jgi:hypothetical protein
VTAPEHIVHWRFQLAVDHDPEPLCETDAYERSMSRSIILRPIIRQQLGAELRECSACARISVESSAFAEL